MEKIINELVNEITNKLSQKMTNENGCGNVTLLVLGAYNRFQEDERDGADYIFNINDVNDLKCCIDGGMSTCEISSIYNKLREKHCNLNQIYDLSTIRVIVENVDGQRKSLSTLG